MRILAGAFGLLVLTLAAISASATPADAGRWLRCDATLYELVPVRRGTYVLWRVRQRCGGPRLPTFTPFEIDSAGDSPSGGGSNGPSGGTGGGESPQ